MDDAFSLKNTEIKTIIKIENENHCLGQVK